MTAILRVWGRTYPYREILKEQKFKWNPTRKTWSRVFTGTTAGDDADILFQALVGDGIYGKVEKMEDD